MKYCKHILLIFALAVSFIACEEKPDDPSPKKVKQMTLIYAVNNNNLSSDLIANEGQMLEAMGNIDTDIYKLMVYKHTPQGPGLYEVVDASGGKEFSLVKQYDTAQLSIDPERVSQVLSDASGEYPDVEINLFFWGHGNGWVNPNKYSNTVSAGYLWKYAAHKDSGLNVSVPELHGFGGEYVDDTRRKTDYIDIDLLAHAIPDDKFNMIWFDCCYMASIEVAYQFRNKCRTFVAYPTEIMAEGLPYNLVIPKIVGDNINYMEAAKALYCYYTGKSDPEPVTVAVMDMAYVDDVAEASKSIFSMGENRPEMRDMQNYSRFYSTPYYDFGQYMRKYAEANNQSGQDGLTEGRIRILKEALSRFILYSAASDTDFNYPVAKPILKENFSGISIHPYMGVNSAREDFYRKLDWYNAVWSSSSAY